MAQNKEWFASMNGSKNKQVKFTLGDDRVHMVIGQGKVPINMFDG
jgi:hypothetical protein